MTQLLDQGADIHATVAIILERSDVEGVTPMHIAALNPDPAIASLLLERGALIDGGDATGNTPLHWAVTFAVHAVAELLLDRGTDIEAKSDRDVTPLHLAVAGSVARELPDQAMIRLLLDRGADINGGEGGRLGTALHLAVGVENRLGLQLLLDRGPDIGAIDDNGLTPCDKATQSSYLRGDSLLSLLCAASPVQTPAPTLQHVLAISELPWVRDGLTDAEREAQGILETIERDHPAIAEVMLSFPWLADTITEDERLALTYLETIIRRTGRVIPSLAQDLSYIRWLADDITAEERGFLYNVTTLQDPSTVRAVLLATDPSEWSTPEPTPTPTPGPASVPSPSSFAWVRDGLTGIEQQALNGLQTIETQQPIIAPVVLSFPWVADSITEDEQSAISYFVIIGGVLQSNFGNNDGAVQDIQARLEVAWLSDGISGAELDLLAQVSTIQEPSTLLAIIFTLQPP